MKKLEVSGIENGTVIDHIPARKVFAVVKVLKLGKSDDQVFLGANLTSKRQGSKGIIKVANKILSDEETDKLALVAPEATVNIIKNFDVVEKRKIKLPDMMRGVAVCINPKCITNNNPVVTKMHVIKQKPIEVRCHYCEHVMEEDDIRVQ